MSNIVTDPTEVAHLIMNWRERVLQDPVYPEKTTDPEARDFRRSVQLFREGIRAARRSESNMVEAAHKIAGAYLLDRRCMRAYMVVIPPQQFDPEAQNYLMDHKLLLKLGAANGPDVGDGTQAAMAVITIMMAVYLCAGNYGENQELITAALLGGQEALSVLEKDASLEGNNDVCEGYLTRPRLHFRLGDVYLTLNNVKQAAKQYAAALKLDPSLTFIRAELAWAYIEHRLKDEETTYKEWKRVLDESHPDARWLGAANGYLASLVLDNPLLGTYSQACGYANAMKSAYRRHNDLYKRLADSGGNEKGLREFVENKFRSMSPSLIAQRKQADTLPKSLLKQMMEGHPEDSLPKIKYSCIKCGKPDRVDGVILRKCSACLQVHYCSPECQQDDWKNHKRSCKLFRESKKQTAEKNKG